MSRSLAGRVVVITGTSRGLGLGLSQRFAALGAKVAGCARSSRASNDGADYFERVDVQDAAATERFIANVIERVGPIDVLINNAAVLAPIDPLRDLELEAFDAHMSINVRAVFVTTRAFVRHLHDVDRRGVLINLSSGAAQKGYASWSAYCASKGAIDRLTESVQLEEHDRLRAYSIAPGVIDTDMQAMIRATPESRFPAREKFLQLKRDDAFFTADYVADAFVDVIVDESCTKEVVHRVT